MKIIFGTPESCSQFAKFLILGRPKADRDLRLQQTDKYLFQQIWLKIPHQICPKYRQEILTSELEREKLFRFSHIAYAYVGKTE